MVRLMLSLVMVVIKKKANKIEVYIAIYLTMRGLIKILDTLCAEKYILQVIYSYKLVTGSNNS